MHDGQSRVRTAGGSAGSTPSADEIVSLDRPDDFVLTRSQVARLLNLSASGVRHIEGRELHPRVRGGVHFFSASEVEGLRGSRAPAPLGLRKYLDDGELAARAFDLFAAKRNVRDVVRELRVPPSVAREWWCEFLAPEDRFVMTPTRELQDTLLHERRLERLDRDLSASYANLSRGSKSARGRSR